MRNATPESARRGVLHLVTSGAPAPEGLPALIRLCQAVGWEVQVFSTPHGTEFMDRAAVGALTGCPVRSEYRAPGSGARTAPADAVLACPLSFNSVNKLAQGIADNMALSLLCEAIGYGVPVTVVPHCKPQLASHPAFTVSLEVLESTGVRVLYDPGAPYEQRMPPWERVVASLPEGARRG